MTSALPRETTLERDWRTSTGCGPFAAIRDNAYNATYGFSLRPSNLRQIQREGPVMGAVEPTPDWIALALGEMVRDEGAGRHEGVYPLSEKISATLSDAIVYDLLSHYEEQIAFGEKTEAILENPVLVQPEDKIAAILKDPVLGHRENSNPSTITEVVRGFKAARALGGPLVFLLPAFPFKDQNLFRSDVPPSAPDLGEISMLIHLHCLALAINQVFRHDVVWLIVSDGSVYEKMFGVPNGSAYQYVSALCDWRTRLNLGRSIHFVDLKDFVDRHDSTFANHGFSVIKRKIVEFLHSSVKESDTSTLSIRDNLHQLARGMLRNRCWNESLKFYGPAALWNVHRAACDKTQLDVEFHKAADELWFSSVDTAITTRHSIWPRDTHG